MAYATCLMIGIEGRLIALMQAATTVANRDNGGSVLANDGQHCNIPSYSGQQLKHSLVVSTCRGLCLDFMFTSVRYVVPTFITRWRL